MSKSFRYRTVRRDRFGRFSKRGRTITRVRVPVKTAIDRRLDRAAREIKRQKKQIREIGRRLKKQGPANVKVPIPESGVITTLAQLAQIQRDFDDFEEIEVETSADYATRRSGR